MTGQRLFLRRFKVRQKQQLKAWNSVLDWSVWIYLVVPGIFIGCGLYMELWTKELPQWSIDLPWQWFAHITLFIVFLTNRAAIFVEPADRLFLMQSTSWMNILRFCCLLWTALHTSLLYMMVLVPFLPFLHRLYDYSLWQFTYAGLQVWLFGLIFIYLEHGLVSKSGLNGWRKIAAEIVMAGLVGVLFFMTSLIYLDANGLVLLVAGAVAAVLLLGVLRIPMNVEQQIERSEKMKSKTTELLMSQVIEKKPVIRLSRPWVWRTSQKIFRSSDPGAALAELRIKAYVRKLAHVQHMASFLSVSLAALILAPKEAAFVLVPCFMLIAVSWLRAQWGQWITEEFIQQYPWTERQKNYGIVLSRCILLLPASALWGAVAGFKFGGIGIAVAGLACIAAIWMLLHLFLLRAYKNKQVETP